MRILVENHYEDGHESKAKIDVDDVQEPTDLDPDGAAMEDLWDDLHDYEGDGHGIGENRNLGFWCKVTILAADNPGLVGQCKESVVS